MWSGALSTLFLYCWNATSVYTETTVLIRVRGHFSVSVTSMGKSCVATVCSISLLYLRNGILQECISYPMDEEVSLPMLDVGSYVACCQEIRGELEEPIFWATWSKVKLGLHSQFREGLLSQLHYIERQSSRVNYSL